MCLSRGGVFVWGAFHDAPLPRLIIQRPAPLTLTHRYTHSPLPNTTQHNTPQRLKEMKEANRERAKRRGGGNQAEQDRARQEREMQRRIAAAQ
jgi:hypothetical protein